MGLRLVPVAAGAWAAALLVTLLPSASPVVALVLWASAIGALGVHTARRYARRSPRAGRARLWTILILSLVGAAVVASHVAIAQPPRVAAERFGLEGGRALVMRAEVTGKIERRASGEWEFDAVATRLSTGRDSKPVRIDVSIRVRPDLVDTAERLDVGAVVEASGTARRAPVGSRAVLLVSATRGVVVRDGPAGPLAVAGDLRRGLAHASAGLPEPGAGLIAGLAVGDTSAVGPDLDAAMKASSLSHLTAVSGANCAIVVGIAFLLVAMLGGSRRARVIGGILALTGFVLLVTPEPSVVRAGAMALIAMLALMLGRTSAGIAVLSVAVTVLLAADPWLASSLGFALSTVATASLLLWARPLAHGMSRLLPRSLALALSVPLAAQLACGPLLVVITPTVPLYGVAANLLAAPAAPVATIIGLAACLAAPIPILQAGLTAIAWLPAAWIAATAEVFSLLPGGQLPWLDGPVGVLTLAAVSVSIGLLVVVAPRASRPPRGRRLPRVRIARGAAAIVLALTVGIVAGGAALDGVAGRFTLPADWSVLACDIGQGDAVMVRSAGAVALIDTGPDPALLEECLARTGIGRIDLLVLTHFDLDHAGGVAAVVGRVDTTLHGVVGTPDAARALRDLQRAGSRIVAGHAGQSGILGAARWRILWPPAGTRAFPPGNDVSVVVEVTGGGMPASVFLGDLSRAPQTALVHSGALAPPYDLVKVAHHGSADQDPELYELLRPRVAVISVGADNTYGHPRAEILTILRGLGTRIARTDRAGIVALWREGSGVVLWRERAEDVAPAR